MTIDADTTPIQSDSHRLEPIVEIGAECLSGSYLLRIHVLKCLQVVFGRFHSGRPISIPVGEYIYVGSAMGRNTQPALARRVVRHTTRSGVLPPHHIRRQLLHHYRLRGWPSARILPQTGKTPFWHIDYLLDLLSVHVVQVYLIHAAYKTEAALAEFLEMDVNTRTVKRGLGARDHPGYSHLLSVRAPEIWWSTLPRELAPLALQPHCRSSQADGL